MSSAGTKRVNMRLVRAESSPAAPTAPAPDPARTALQVPPPLVVHQSHLCTHDQRAPASTTSWSPGVLLGQRLPGIQHTTAPPASPARPGYAARRRNRTLCLMHLSADPRGVDELPGRPPITTTSSTGSRVVPATDPHDRAPPASVLSRLDFPTFGRPSNATRRSPVSAGPPTSDNRWQHLEQASSRSPLPACAARHRVRLPQPTTTARPRRPRTDAPLVRRQHHGLAGPPQQPTTASSVSVAPTVASTTNSTVGQLHRQLRLLGHPPRSARAGRAPTTGIDDGEPPPAQSVS